MTIIFHHGAATRRISDNRINLPGGDFFMPGLDRRPYRGVCHFRCTNMMGKSATAMRFFADNHLYAKPVQHPNGAGINIRIQRTLRASGQ